jgi:hypothetical protein
MSEEPRCYFCGEKLKSGDVCYGCYEYGVDEAYKRGYEEGYRKGLEEGIAQGRSSVLYEIESDLSIPPEVRRKVRWML